MIHLRSKNSFSKLKSNYLSSNLVAALASLHMNDFPHGLTKNWSKSSKLKFLVLTPSVKNVDCASARRPLQFLKEQTETAQAAEPANPAHFSRSFLRKSARSKSGRYGMGPLSNVDSKRFDENSVAFQIDLAPFITHLHLPEKKFDQFVLAEYLLQKLYKICYIAQDLSYC